MADSQDNANQNLAVATPTPSESPSPVPDRSSAPTSSFSAPEASAAAAAAIDDEVVDEPGPASDGEGEDEREGEGEGEDEATGLDEGELEDDEDGDQDVADDRDDDAPCFTAACQRGSMSPGPDRQPVDERVDEADRQDDPGDGHLGGRPTKGIERPVSWRGTPRTFTIVRLIENTTKSGDAAVAPAIQIGAQAPWFIVDYGDFLLNLSTPRAEIAQVRNYMGQERYIPRRMLQQVYQPWDVPAKIRIRDDGVALPLAFLLDGKTAGECKGVADFEAGEAVMVMEDLDGTPDQQVLVADYERHAGRFAVSELKLDAVEVPWGIRVDARDLAAARAKASAPKLPRAAMRAAMKRKRNDKDAGDEGEDEEPARTRVSKRKKYNDEDGDGNSGEGLSKSSVARKTRRAKKAKVDAQGSEDLEDLEESQSGNKLPGAEGGARQPAASRAARKIRRESKKKAAKKNLAD